MSTVALADRRSWALFVCLHRLLVSKLQYALCLQNKHRSISEFVDQGAFKTVVRWKD